MAGWVRIVTALLLAGWLLSCGGDTASRGAGERPERGRRGTGGAARGPRSAPPATALPVETTEVRRRAISTYIETNGTLEAENEVDIVARVSAPVIALHVEEGALVNRGQRLAQLDDEALRARLEIDRVALEEAQHAFRRAEELRSDELISGEDWEQAKARYESARAQVEASEIELGYTDIRAPFSGRIVRRYVDFAQHVAANAALFRLSDFDPLLCPIQVPERDLNRLRLGQQAYLKVESWPDERFDARVLRIRPVIDAESGMIQVTLQLAPTRRLRPGMFARVFLRTETRDNVLVVPRAALSLESIGDTVYVADSGLASRREVELGFREGDFVEVVRGVDEGEAVVVVGQDGLTEGTPVEALNVNREATSAGAAPARPQMPPAQHGRPSSASDGRPNTPPAAERRGRPPGERRDRPQGERRGRSRRPPIDPDSLTPEQLERIKQRMRQRGMTDEQIKQRLEAMRQRSDSPQ